MDTCSLRGCSWSIVVSYIWSLGDHYAPTWIKLSMAMLRTNGTVSPSRLYYEIKTYLSFGPHMASPSLAFLKRLGMEFLLPWLHFSFVEHEQLGIESTERDAAKSLLLFSGIQSVVTRTLEGFLMVALCSSTPNFLVNSSLYANRNGLLFDS